LILVTGDVSDGGGTGSTLLAMARRAMVVVGAQGIRCNGRAAELVALALGCCHDAMVLMLLAGSEV
jgi:hypothetical protein